MNNPNEQQPRTLEDAEAIVELYNALERLKKNPDFKVVFETHLFTNEVIRLHSLLAHPDSAIVSSRDNIISDLDALSNIKFSLQIITQIGSTTKDQLEEFRAAQLESEGE